MLLAAKDLTFKFTKTRNCLHAFEIQMKFRLSFLCHIALVFDKRLPLEVAPFGMRRRLSSSTDVLQLLASDGICWKPFRYLLLKMKQIQGFRALHKCSIKRHTNGITVRNAQMAGTFQFHRKIRVNVNTSTGIVQTTKAIIIATANRIIFLSCRSRLLCSNDSCCRDFLFFDFKVLAMKPYIMANKQTGIIINVMKFAMRYLFSVWASDGPQCGSQYVLFSKWKSLKV